MSEAWPEPEGGWLDIDDIGDVMTDDEIRALGFEPTASGWRPIERKRNDDEPDALPDEDWRRYLRRRYG